MKTEIRRQVKCCGEWITCKVSKTSGLEEGWLHYELRDGTNGLARPGTWRVAPDTQKKKDGSMVR